METKIPPPVYALLSAVLMWTLSKIWPGAFWLDYPWRWAGPVIMVSAFLLDLDSLFIFRRNHTTINPLHPEQTSTLVTEGLYRFTRNPMYLGLLIVLTGWSIYLGNITALFVLPLFALVITYWQIVPEERVLEQKFGDHYLAYKRSVRRWL